MFVDEMPFCLHKKLLYTVEEVSVGEMNVDQNAMLPPKLNIPIIDTDRNHYVK